MTWAELVVLTGSAQLIFANLAHDVPWAASDTYVHVALLPWALTTSAEDQVQGQSRLYNMFDWLVLIIPMHATMLLY